jgi:hypothetical protein
MGENDERKDAPEQSRPGTGDIPQLLGSLEDPDAGARIDAAKSLGELAMRGQAGSIADAGGIRILIDCFSSGSPEEKPVCARTLRNLAEGGEVHRIIGEGGFPILHGMVLYGNWDPSPQVIEALSETSHPEALILLQEIVNLRARALERDTFRDVYEMIREPFPEGAVRKEGDLPDDPFKDIQSADRPEGDGFSRESSPGLMRSVLQRLSRGGAGSKDRANRVVLGRDIPTLLAQLESDDATGTTGPGEIMAQLFHRVKRGWGIDIINQGGVRSLLGRMEDSDDVQRRMGEVVIERLMIDVDARDVKESSFMEQILSGLDSPDPLVRVFSLRMIRQLNERLKPSDVVKKQGIREVLKALDDPDATVRSAAIVLLGELGSSRAIKPLRERLEAESDPRVKKLAQRSLDRLA